MFGGGYRRAEDVGDNPQYKFTKYAAGLAASVYGAKKLGVNLLNTKTGRYAQNALAGALTSLAGHTVPKLYGKHDAWDILSASGSNSMRMAARGYDEITTQMTTAYNHAQRESVLFNYLGSFTKTGKITEDANTRNQITSLFKEYTRAKSSDKATKAVTSDVIARAMSIIGKDNLHPNLTQSDLLSQLHAKIRTHHPTEEKRTILKEIFSNVHNQRQFRDLFVQTIDTENKAFMSKATAMFGRGGAITAAAVEDVNYDPFTNLNDPVTKKATALFGRGARGITIGDLEDTEANPLHPHIERYFKKLGISKTQLADVYGTATKKFQGQALLVGQKNPHVTRDLWQSFRGAQTGLVLTSKGVVPLSMMEGEAKKGIFNTLNKLQIPLLPGVMNVPLSILNFNKYDEKVSLGLGRIGKQRDLLNIKSALRDEKRSFGITFGKNLLTYDVNNGSLTAHTDLNLDIIGLQGNSKGRGLVEARGARETPFKDKASFLKYLKGGDPDRTSGLYGFANDGNKLFGLIEKNPEKFFDVTYHPDSGFDLIPKNDKVSLVFNYLRSQGDYKYKAINPKQLLNFLANNANDLDKVKPEHLAEALDHVLHSSVDIGESVHDYLKKTRGGPGESSLTRKAMELLDLANTDPTEAYAYAKRNSDQFLKEGSTDLYRAAQRIISNPYDLTEAAGYGKEGALDKLKSGFLGSSGKSPLQLELEKAVLKERLRDAGEAAFFTKTGLDRQAVENLAATHVAQAQGYIQGVVGKDALTQAYEDHLGVTSAVEAVKLSASILSTSSGVQGINESAFRQFTTAFIDAEKLVTGKSVDARVLKYALEESSSVSNNSVFTEAQSLKYFGAIMHNPTGDAKSVFSRIDGSKFEPYFLKSDQFGDVGSYAINGNVGIGDSLTGFLDQTTPLNGLTYKATVMARAANNVLGEVGLGVGNGSMSTVGNAIAAYGITRVLPMVAAFYAWGMVNNTLDSAGLPTIPAIAANVIGLGGRVKARVQDATGLTGLFKNAVNSIPGLDQYFTPKDSEEYDDHLAFGDDEIRYRRNWILGNRSPATGTSVEFYRPSFYRRWRSNWTNAKNVKAFNPFIDWVREVEDRPYSTDSKGYNPQGGQLGGGGGVGQGSGGGSGSGGGIGGTGFGPGGMGDGITGAGDGGHGLILGESKGELTGPGDAISPLSITNKFKSISGFYGAFLRYNPAFAAEEIKLQVQDPAFATSIGRLMYANRTGEFTGPLGEFLRRFVGGRNQAEDAINPLPNTMPDFLGKKFHTGDPFVRTILGELTLPGDAFERSHPEAMLNTALTGKARYDSYDTLTKMEILAQVDPQSFNYRKERKNVEGLNLSPQGFRRYQEAVQQATDKGELYRLYSRKNVETETHRATVQDIGVDGEVYTDQGAFSLAGVKFSYDAYQEGYSNTLAKFGIGIGQTVSIKTVAGSSNLFGETVIPGVINGANIEIMNSKYGSYDPNDKSPLAYQEQYGHSALEGILHSDNMFCMSPDTTIVTDKGLELLGSIKIGDSVRTHMGSFKPVVAIKRGKPIEKVYEILIKGSNIPIVVTGNHRMIGAKAERRRSGISRESKKLLKPLGDNPTLEYIKVDTLKDYDFLAYKPREFPQDQPNPVINIQELDPERFLLNGVGVYVKAANNCKYYLKNPQITITEDLARLFGYYAAEGSIVCKKSGSPMALVFTFHSKEKEYYEDVIKILLDLKLAPKLTFIEGTETARIAVNSIELALLVQTYFGKTKSKKITDSILPNKTLRGEFLKGLFRGDGPKTGKVKYHNITLRALELLTWTRDCLFDLWTLPATVSTTWNKGEFKGYTCNIGYAQDFADFIDGNVFYTQKEIVAGGERRNWTRVCLEGYIINQIASIKEIEYLGDVIDITVEDDHTFTCLNVTVHNSNKFLRVRSALEQFERGEVYGTDNFDWLHPISTGLKPTITSYVNRDPLGAAIGAAITASLFVKSTSDKIAVAKYAGGAMALLSMLHKIIGSPKPDQYMHDADVDEYVDTIKYVKYSRIQKEADRRIMGHEGSSEELSVLQQLKTYAEKQVKRTMIGYDQENGTLEEALATLPRRQRQIAKEILLYGSNNEKEDFYDLLPRAQKAVLGDYLGKNAPQKKSLEELGDRYNIPDKDWTGWSALVSDRHVETLIRQNEGVQAGRPGRSTLDKAKQILGADFQVPIMDAGHGSITAILDSTPNIQYDVERIRAPRSSLNLHFNTNEDVAQAYRDRAIDEVSGAR